VMSARLAAAQAITYAARRANAKVRDVEYKLTVITA